MAHRLPRINEEEIVLNALFIQPTYHCALNCEGCYVKGMERAAPFISTNEQIDTLIDTMRKFSGLQDGGHYNPFYQANQITVALDVPPSTLGADNWGPIRYFWERAQRIPMGAKLMGEDEGRTTEFHLTTTSPGNLLSYYPFRSIDEFFQGEVSWKYWDVISFSTLTLKDIEFLVRMKTTRPNIERNWNFTVFNENTVKMQMEHFKEVAANVDSIYFVLHKPATGANLDIKKVQLYFDTLAVIKRELGDEFYSKVNIDGCVVDARKYRDTGFGCSSNVSRFQVWPNGSVSGCPYQQSPITGGAGTVDGVVANIRAAAKKYEFDSCRIPETLHPGSERSRERIAARPQDSRFRLEIID